MRPQTSVQPRPRGLRLASLALAIATGLSVWLAAGTAYAAVFDPLCVMSDETLRAAGSMSRADIQAFLETMPGVLKSYSAAEGGPNGLHSKVVKPASQIIAEAALYWNVNPRVILATLQKEQSLLTMTAPSSTRLARAMGCGVYSGSPDMHPGFGDQVWTGTQKLGQTTGPYTWYPGKPKSVFSYPDNHSIIIVPKNQITWNLYTYTPYYPQKGVWDIYVRYFGDPLAPPRLKPVYEFLGKRTGAYFYTSSEAQRYKLSRDTRNWTFRGASMSVDASAALNTVPLYRLKNTRTGRYILTANATEMARLLSLRYRHKSYYQVQAVVAWVSLTPETGATPVYRLYNAYRNTYYYTTSVAKRDALVRLSGIRRWKNNGVAFFLGAYTPPAPDPATPPAG